MRSRNTLFPILVMAGLASCESAPEAFTGPDLLTVQMDRVDGAQAVTGGGSYFSDLTDVLVTFSLHGVRDTEGVKGTFHLRAHREHGGGAILGGDIVCLTVDGNRAWMAGYTLRWRRGPTEYTPMGFMVVDNGEGNDSAPDEIRFSWGLQGGEPPFADPGDWCTRQPQDFTFPLETGNIQIHE